MSVDAAAVGLGVVVCGLAGLLVAPTIGRLPEPSEAEPSEAGPSDRPPKETYAAIAARPGLRWSAPLAAAIAGGLVGLAVGLDWSLLFLLPLVPVSVAL